MGRRPVPEEEKKKNITLRLSSKTIEKLRKEENYNALVENLIKNYFISKK